MIIPLHIHLHWSLLTGIPSIREIVDLGGSLYLPTIALVNIALWIFSAWWDIKMRTVPRPVLFTMVVLGALGRHWVWWVLTVALLACPARWRKYSWCIVPLALLAGNVTGQSGLALTLIAAAVPWSLGWWGGGDSLLLIALGFRHDTRGLVVGAVAMVAVALVVMVARKQSVLCLLPAFQDLMAMRSAEIGVSPEFELPAAPALALAGLVMEGVRLWALWG